MTQTPAQANRAERIKALLSTYLPESNGHQVTDPSLWHDVATDVLNLRSLGKTERWSTATAGFYRAVAKTEAQPVAERATYLTWAINEGVTMLWYANL